MTQALYTMPVLDAVKQGYLHPSALGDPMPTRLNNYSMCEEETGIRSAYEEA